MRLLASSLSQETEQDEGLNMTVRKHENPDFERYGDLATQECVSEGYVSHAMLHMEQYAP